MSEDGPNGSRHDPLSVEVIREDPVVPLSVIIRIMVIGISLAILLPVVVTVGIDQLRKDSRIKENRESIYTQCVALENRDTVIVKMNNAILGTLETIPKNQRSPAIVRTIAELEDVGIALEPPDEKECELP